MDIPTLMPHQMEAFNGDHFIESEFLNLKEQYNLSFAIELGTCLGSTTLWLAKHFQKVYTVEINEGYFNIALERIGKEFLQNVCILNDNSVNVLPFFLKSTGSNAIVFIDSHWLDVCPMQEELSIIADSGYKPVIAIHDFLVPTEVDKLGYDMIHHQPFNFEWIKPKLDKIYGENGYIYYYNSDATSTEIKRGIIYIVPKTKENE